jgi:hypothetical protein
MAKKILSIVNGKAYHATIEKTHRPISFIFGGYGDESKVINTFGLPIHIETPELNWVNKLGFTLTKIRQDDRDVWFVVEPRTGMPLDSCGFQSSRTAVREMFLKLVGSSQEKTDAAIAGKKTWMESHDYFRVRQFKNATS